MTIGEKLIISCCLHSSYEIFGKIRREKLFAEDELTLFKFVTDYYKTTSSLPTSAILEKEAGVATHDVEAAPEHYLTEYIKRHVYTTLGEGIPTIVKGLKKDPMASLDTLSSMVSALRGDEFSTDTPYARDAVKRFEEYRKKKGTGGITYLSTGDDELDAVTYGYQEGDLWTIGGRAGTKKTFTLLFLALSCLEVLPDSFSDILFVTNEMTDTEIIHRLDAIRFKLNYAKFQEGNLEPADENRYKKGLTMLEKSRNRMQVLFNVITLEELRVKASIYKPSIVFVDGSYLFYPNLEDGLAKNLRITRGLKQLGKDFKIPIVNTTQLRKKTGRKMIKDFLSGQDEFYYGGYVQDSDIAARTFLTPSMVYEEVIGWDFVKHRRHAHCSLDLKASLVNMDFHFMKHKDRSSSAEEEVLEY